MNEPEAAALRDALGARPIEVLNATNRSAVFDTLEARRVDCVIFAARLDDEPGVELTRELNARWPGLPVLVRAADSIEWTAQAISAGVTDVVDPAATPDEILHALDKAFAMADSTLGRPPPPSAAGTLLGSSPLMKEVRELLGQVAPTSATVLIRGETGTGKELAARAIHERSPRREGPFVKIDCTALPETLLESELFGYEKGAFTGAMARKLGRVELAAGGTLFFDEIGELSPPLQAKLLRLLQDREFSRLGSVETRSVDVRVIAATHRDLETMVQRGQFRQDLFYRLNVVPLWLPPLRARREDIDALARHFCAGTARENARQVTLDDGALEALRAERWPGNVRQLENFVERLVVLAPGPRVRREDVHTELGRQVRFVTQSAMAHAHAGVDQPDAEPAPRNEPSLVQPLTEEMREAEKRALERALRHSGGNRSRAARLLGISRSTLYEKLAEHGLLQS